MPSEVDAEPGVLDAADEDRTAAEGGSRGRFAGRDVLGVNAVVLALIMLPLAFGFYARVHWGFLFPPDSRYYVMMTLRDMGKSDTSALTQQFQLSGNPAEAWYFDHGDPVWQMVQPRMLYPLLSVPFVALFGLKVGMLAVPMLAIAITVFAVARLAQRLYGPFAALAAAGLLAASGTLLAFTEAITDPIAVALVALMLLNLPIGRRVRAHNLVFLAMLAVGLCLTRQVMPMVAGMAFGGWAWAWLFPSGGQPRRVRNEWLAPGAVIAGVTFLGQMIGSLFAPYDVTKQFLYAANEPTLGTALKHIHLIVWRLVRDEVLYMVHNDRFLLILMALPFVWLAVRFRSVVNGLYLGAFAGTMALVVANGIPSQMRYESVLFPLAALAAASLVHRFAPPALRGAGEPIDATWWQGGPRRVPALAAGGVAALALVMAWSATHGSKSMIDGVPTAPASAAALAGTKYAHAPGGSDPAEQTLKYGLIEADKATHEDSGLWAFVDWRHPFRYQPQGAADPGWADRGPDGTAVVRFGDFANPQVQRFAEVLTLRQTVDPDSIKILTRTRSDFGEDITFQIADTAKHVHTGHATVLYPVREHVPGTITELVYDS